MKWTHVFHMHGIAPQAASAAWKRRYEGIVGEGEGFVLYQLDVQKALVSGDSDEVREILTTSASRD